MMTPEMFATAYEQRFERTVRFLLSKGLDRDAAEEYAQAAWAKGWEARAQLRDQGRILPWVNSIAFHTLCNETRNNSKHSVLGKLADCRNCPSVGCAAIDAERLIAHCCLLDRKLLHDRYLWGFSISEIARRRAMTAGSVRVRIHRCKAALRAFLESAGNTSGFREELTVFGRFAA